MSNQQQRNVYFETEVLSATPQKLRLLLIEGSLRLLRETRTHWQQNQFELGGVTLGQARTIIAELLSSIDRQQLPSVTEAVSNLYAYVFTQLLEAGMTHDLTKVDDSLRVLEIERETWRQVCEQLALAAPRPHTTFPDLNSPQLDTPSMGSFSLEA